MSYDGVSPAELAARLRAPGILSLPTVASTLDVVHELAAAGAPAGTLVLADEQVQGRGRHGRVWHSPPGVGIWMGCLMRPGRRAAAGVLSLRVGLAVAEALEAVGVPAQLKWPNDVLIGSRKVAGVLCEARWQGEEVRWVAVGIGINVAAPVPEAVADVACAVGERAPDVTRVGILELLVPRLLAVSPAPELTRDELEAFARFDWLAGRELAGPVAGTARGVSSEGALLVETAEGMAAVTGGSVVAARAAAGSGS